jgi:prepilin-type N-terminal cleavage/methylation domain-containing protein
MTTTRRGFTLVELMVALILLTMVGGVTYRLLVTNQRVTRAQTARVGMQDNVRAGALVVANELREVGYDANLATAVGAIPGSLIPVGSSSDLFAIGPDSITYRAMRAVGFTCALNAANGDITVRAWSAQWNRTLVLTDSILMYVENNSSTNTDDIWVHAGLTVVPAAANCPDGTAGFRFRIAFPALSGLTVANVFAGTASTIGSPVRAFEVMQMRTYVSGGQLWLGMRSLSAGGNLQPVLGPFSNGAANQRGMILNYLDAANNVTAVLGNVRSVQVVLRGITDVPVQMSGKYAGIDSLAVTTQVALRNAPRP